MALSRLYLHLCNLCLLVWVAFATHCPVGSANFHSADQRNDYVDICIPRKPIMENQCACNRDWWRFGNPVWAHYAISRNHPHPAFHHPDHDWRLCYQRPTQVKCTYSGTNYGRFSRRHIHLGVLRLLFYIAQPFQNIGATHFKSSSTNIRTTIKSIYC